MESIPCNLITVLSSVHFVEYFFRQLGTHQSRYCKVPSLENGVQQINFGQIIPLDLATIKLS